MGAAAQPRASVRVLSLDRPPRSHGAVSGPSQSRSAAPFPGGPAAGAVPTGKFSRGAHACEPPLSSCNRWRQGAGLEHAPGDAVLQKCLRRALTLHAERAARGMRRFAVCHESLHMSNAVYGWPQIARIGGSMAPRALTAARETT